MDIATMIERFVQQFTHSGLMRSLTQEGVPRAVTELAAKLAADERALEAVKESARPLEDQRTDALTGLATYDTEIAAEQLRLEKASDEQLKSACGPGAFAKHSAEVAAMQGRLSAFAQGRKRLEDALEVVNAELEPLARRIAAADRLVKATKRDLDEAKLRAEAMALREPMAKLAAKLAPFREALRISQAATGEMVDHAHIPEIFFMFGNELPHEKPTGRIVRAVARANVSRGRGEPTPRGTVVDLPEAEFHLGHASGHWATEAEWAVETQQARAAVERIFNPPAAAAVADAVISRRIAERDDHLDRVTAAERQLESARKRAET